MIRYLFVQSVAIKRYIIGIGYHEVCICDECAAELLAEPQFDYSVKFVDIPEEE